MNKYSSQDILAFIDAARRFPNTPEKELYVRWLVGQYQLRCEADVINDKVSTSFDKYNKGEDVEQKDLQD